MNPSLLISVHSIWATRIDSSPSWRSCSPINPTLNSPSTTTHHWIAVNVPMLPTWWVHFRFLIYIWQIIILKRSADDAWKPFESMVPAFQDFRDASYGQCNYKCTVYIYHETNNVRSCTASEAWSMPSNWSGSMWGTSTSAIMSSMNVSRMVTSIGPSRISLFPLVDPHPPPKILMEYIYNHNISDENPNSWRLRAHLQTIWCAIGYPTQQEGLWG